MHACSMKFVVLLLFCLLAETLAKPSLSESSGSSESSESSSKQSRSWEVPSSEEDGRYRRSIESNLVNLGSGPNNGTSDGGISIVDALSSVLDNPSDYLARATATLSQVAGSEEIKKLSELIPKLTSGTVPIEAILNTLSQTNVQKLLQELTPLQDLLKSIPLVSSIVDLTQGVISVPVSLIGVTLTTIVSLLATIQKFISSLLQ